MEEERPEVDGMHVQGCCWLWIGYRRACETGEREEVSEGGEVEVSFVRSGEVDDPFGNPSRMSTKCSDTVLLGITPSKSPDGLARHRRP